jgi:hypothetical protein
MSFAANEQKNADLVWDLNKISKHKQAMDFVKKFENKL